MTDPIELEKAVEFYKRHRWRKCSDEMPGHGVEVLACCFNEEFRWWEYQVMQGFYMWTSMGGPQSALSAVNEATPIKATHWMHLPEAPK